AEPAPPPPPPPEEEPAPPPPPAAEPAPSMWYAAVHGGAVWLNEIEMDAFGDAFRIDPDTGWAAGGALGYRYGDGLRAEIEGTYRQNDGDFFFIDPVTGPDLEANADVSSLSLMLNVLYDFDMGSFFRPYIGAGIGTSFVDIDLTEIGGPDEENDDGWAFAYQFIGGFSVPMPNSGFEFFADYRYHSTAGLDMDFEGNVQDHDDYESHTVMGGVRFNF
ncbi:MAG: outer membrane protein, partial [Alphaproteobacteria bacterium]